MISMFLLEHISLVYAGRNDFTLTLTLTPSVCHKDNGGCGTDFKCFVLNETDSLCRCPKGRYKDTSTSTPSCKLPKSVIRVEGKFTYLNC